jgi:hypothetical protein
MHRQRDESDGRDMMRTCDALKQDTSQGMRVEIPAQQVLRLLAAGQLRAMDLRCLDEESRHCLRRLLLRACASCCTQCDLCPGMFQPGKGD